eukprot:4429835-Pleurochrysis_carterae.AAC.2
MKARIKLRLDSTKSTDVLSVRAVVDSGAAHTAIILSLRPGYNRCDAMFRPSTLPVSCLPLGVFVTCKPGWTRFCVV